MNRLTVFLVLLTTFKMQNETIKPSVHFYKTQENEILLTIDNLGLTDDPTNPAREFSMIEGESISEPVQETNYALENKTIWTYYPSTDLVFIESTFGSDCIYPIFFTSDVNQMGFVRENEQTLRINYNKISDEKINNLKVDEGFTIENLNDPNIENLQTYGFID